MAALLGADLAQEDYIDGVDPNYETIFAARILLGIDHKFNDNVAFTETFEVYENLFDFEDVRILNNAGFTSNVSKVLAFKLSHVLAWDNQPVTGFAELDQTVLATLVATIL